MSSISRWWRWVKKRHVCLTKVPRKQRLFAGRSNRSRLQHLGSIRHCLRSACQRTATESWIYVPHCIPSVWKNSKWNLQYCLQNNREDRKRKTGWVIWCLVVIRPFSVRLLYSGLHQVTFTGFCWKTMEKYIIRAPRSPKRESCNEGAVKAMKQATIESLPVRWSEYRLQCFCLFTRSVMVHPGNQRNRSMSFS